LTNVDGIIGSIIAAQDAAGRDTVTKLCKRLEESIVRPILEGTFAIDESASSKIRGKTLLEQVAYMTNDDRFEHP